MLEWGVESRYRHDGAGCFHARRWPDIPRKPNTCVDVRQKQDVQQKYAPSRSSTSSKLSMVIDGLESRASRRVE